MNPLWDQGLPVKATEVLPGTRLLFINRSGMRGCNLFTVGESASLLYIKDWPNGTLYVRHCTHPADGILCSFRVHPEDCP